MTVGEPRQRAVGSVAKALASAALALANTGCSFFMPTLPGEPSEIRKSAAVQCGGYSYPVVDTISAGVGVVNIAIAASADESEETVTYYGAEIGKDAGLALGITQAVLFGAGAVYGYIHAARCNKARERYRLDGTDTAGTADGNTAQTNAGGGYDSDLYPTGERTAAPDEPAARRTSPSEFYESLPSWSALRRAPLDDPAATPTPQPRPTTSPPRAGR